MEPTKPNSLPSTNPPSVEVAYKRKCIALKKRLSDIEDENELMRVRNKRGWQYIQKMRLESCILLERLAESTGMANEQDDLMPDPELEYDRRMARATARMKYGHIPAPGNGGPPYFADETEGSSDEQPSTPQPQERPLRIKRSRKSPTEKDNEGYDEQGSGSGQPPASSDSQAAARRPTQDEMTSSFRIQTGSNGNGNEDGAPSAADKDESNSRLPSSGPTQEPARNGTGPEITEDQQQQQQQQPAPEPEPEPEPATADNTTTPMDMDTKEEPKEG